MHEKYLVNLCYLIALPNQTQYRARRLETGISKPSIFSGLDHTSTLRLPCSAGSDIMHLATLNISDLLISLWHATIDCTEPDTRVPGTGLYSNRSMSGRSMGRLSQTPSTFCQVHLIAPHTISQRSLPAATKPGSSFCISMA